MMDSQRAAVFRASSQNAVEEDLPIAISESRPMTISTQAIPLLLLLIGVSLLSGVGDSQGFVHAARMWHGGKLVWSECGKSALGFGTGICTYWLAVRYLHRFGVRAPETQTLIWFGVTIVGVAFVSGRFIRWQMLDQIVAVLVLLGIGWLMFHTG